MIHNEPAKRMQLEEVGDNLMSELDENHERIPASHRIKSWFLFSYLIFR